jgi:hypothetical protein
MTMMVMMMDMKIVQNKKAREEETGTPEWVGNPSVQIVVIPGWWIISHHRRTFVIVILVNYFRWNVFAARRGLTFCVLFGSRCKRQTKLSGQALECLQSFIISNG